MGETHAGNLSLVGGALALDFTNTAAGRDTATQIERLREATDVVDFAAHAGGIGADTARRIHAAMTDEVAETVLRDARKLREAIYGTAVAVARRRGPSQDDLEIVKGFAQKAMATATLAPVGDGSYRLDFSAAPAEEALLGPIAWSAMELLTALDPARLKQCMGEGCGWLFLDLSKNNSRRWCDMATCGNRTKAQRHRTRH